jgi:hypothetical protein
MSVICQRSVSILPAGPGIVIPVKSRKSGVK